MIYIFNCFIYIYVYANINGCNICSTYVSDIRRRCINSKTTVDERFATAAYDSIFTHEIVGKRKFLIEKTKERMVKDYFLMKSSPWQNQKNTHRGQRAPGIMFEIENKWN